MASNKFALVGPVALTATTVNVFSPPTLTGGTNPPPVSTNTFYTIRHVRAVNTTATAINVALWKQVTIGASPVAGKEFIWGGTATLTALDAGRGVPVPANGFIEAFGLWRLSSDETDKFIVGVASATGVTIEMEVEIGVV